MPDNGHHRGGEGKNIMAAWVARIVEASCRRPALVAGAAAALCALALVYIAGAFAMTTDTAALISPRTPWRQREAVMDAAFPHAQPQFIAVVDGATPELAEKGAAALTAKLADRKTVIRAVRRPDAGPFFDQNGLLYLSVKDVQDTTSGLISAQPFLGPLASDPSLRGVMESLSALRTGVKQGVITLERVRKPVHALADALEAAEQGRPSVFSWEALMADEGGFKMPRRRLILIDGKLDFGALEPGAEVRAGVKQAAGELGLDPAHGVTVRVTGPVPLADEEFSSLADRAWLVGGVMLAAMLLMLWLALRSIRLIACVLGTTLVGLVLAAAVGLLAVGRFNLISVAFIPLFVGLGIDFGIQMAVRFRAERLAEPDIKTALGRAARGIGGSLAVAGAAVSLGLFAFLPTAYIGVSELGVIAGLGMLIALALNLTLLPALVVLLKPKAQGLEVGNPAMAPLDHFLVRRRKTVLWGFAVSVLISIALIPFVRFDFNPLHLRDPHGEAMSSLLDLMKDPDQTPNTIDVLRPTLAAAEQAAKQLSALPQVHQTVTLSSFVPEEQDAKLVYIQDASLLLDPTLNPFDVKPAPTDAETVASLKVAATDLLATAGKDPSPAASDARRLAAVIEKLASGPVAARERASQLLIDPLNVMLNQVRNLLSAQTVTLQSLPPELTRDWLAPDGRARVSVFPKGDSNDNANLKRFARAVQTLAPDASGGPISIQEAAKTVAGAFIEAGILSLIAVTILLLFVLKSIKEVAFTLAPVVLAGFLTLATCVLIGQPINFANVIAFPLLFGVGVAFHIYFVMAWRAGQGDLLQSSLARAVFFSAWTTGMAFGSLWLSSHPGTASMGKILMISIVWTLVCALIFEPALLGPVKGAGATGRRPS